MGTEIMEIVVPHCVFLVHDEEDFVVMGPYRLQMVNSVTMGTPPMEMDVVSVNEKDPSAYSYPCLLLPTRELLHHSICSYHHGSITPPIECDFSHFCLEMDDQCLSVDHEFIIISLLLLETSPLNDK